MSKKHVRFRIFTTINPYCGKHSGAEWALLQNEPHLSLHFKAAWLGLLGGWAPATVSWDPLIDCWPPACGASGAACKGVLGAERAPMDPADLQTNRRQDLRKMKRLSKRVALQFVNFLLPYLISAYFSFMSSSELTLSITIIKSIITAKL